MVTVRRRASWSALRAGARGKRRWGGDALKAGKEGRRKDGDNEVPFSSVRALNRFRFSETKFGTTWRIYSRHFTAFQHKVDLQPLR